MVDDDDKFAKSVWRPPAAEPSVVTDSKPPSGLWVLSVVLASLLLPGAGQLMNRTWRSAAIIFVVWTAASVTHLVPVWTITCLYSGFEAGWTAMKRRREVLDRHEGEHAQRQRSDQ